MTSVQNRLPQLSGNKWLIIVIAAVVFGACSPKVRPVAPHPPVEQRVEQPKPEKPAVKLPARTSVIALLLPFGLDHLTSNPGYSSTGLGQAYLALDYYQGFKLALDSLTGKGFNYKVQLFDTKGTIAQAHALANNPQVKTSDLIVGPVFADDLKAFTTTLITAHKPILSPLAPSDPAVFKNASLITAIPPLEVHAWAAAQYAIKAFKPQWVFILKSGYSEENGYITPFKKAIDSLGKKHIAVRQLTVVRGQLSSIIPQLSATGQNVFVVPSTSQQFLSVTLRTLDSLAAIYPVVVIGHPNWQKFAFLSIDQLQRLNTYITGSDKVNYKATATTNFIDDYREAYHLEPSDYAIKGFDEGMYFGALLGKNAGELKGLDKDSFEGLHNSFNFTYKSGLGWVNTHVNIYHYSNFDLKKVE